MPRAQRILCFTCPERRSVANPAACGMLMYAVFQPPICISKEVCASSVTVSVAIPPISSSAVRRNTVTHDILAVMPARERPIA